MTPEDFDAVLFDLDGVLTDTASVHAACWKKTFDAFLREWATARGEAFESFEIETDYKLYVDGKPRFAGVQSFLVSRGIDLPYGDTGDAPSHDTVCGVGNRKNTLINEVLRSQGVEVYEGSVAWVRRLREQGTKTAVVSSSANCGAVLEAAGIADLFDTMVDGKLAAARKIAGKPAPDTFLAAAKALGVEARRAVVVEDAISGVEAGRAGGFGLVIGVDRTGDPQALLDHGADLVVGDLAELSAGPS